MKPSEIKIFYRNNLPHYQPVGGIFFVTFRLHGSLPKVYLLNLKEDYELKVAQLRLENPKNLEHLLNDERKRFFKDYDNLLDSIEEGPKFLTQPEIANIVVDQLKRHNGKLYNLVAYCIMSNHVHILIDTITQIPDSLDIIHLETLDHEPLHLIMKRIKGASAYYANRALNRTGKFWQKESYDHYVQNEIEFHNIINYILDNPVKAGIVSTWSDYPYSYLKGF